MREILLIFLALLSLPFAWRNPVIGLIIYLCFNIIRPEVLFWGMTDGSFVFKIYYAVLISTVVFKGYLKDLARLSDATLLQIFWLTVAIILSSAFSLCPSTDVQVFYVYEFMKIFGLCLMIFLIAKDYTTIRKIQNTLIWCFFIMGLSGIQQHFAGSERLEGLLGGGWGDSNGIAAMFVMFLPVALATYFTQQGRVRFVTVSGIFVILIVIVCTKSRGGLMGLLCSMAAFGYYSRNMKKAVAIGALAVLIALPFVTDSYLERLQALEGTESLDLSARSRFVLWRAGMMIFIDNPITGSGFLTYPETKMKYENRFIEIDDEVRHAVFNKEKLLVTHNAFIQVLADLGMLGGIPFCLLMLGGILKGLKVRSIIDRISPCKDELILLAGICAGLTGFTICIVTIDAVLCPFIYIQACFAALLLKDILNKRTLQNGSGTQHHKAATNLGRS